MLDDLQGFAFEIKNIKQLNLCQNNIIAVYDIITIFFLICDLEGI